MFTKTSSLLAMARSPRTERMTFDTEDSDSARQMMKRFGFDSVDSFKHYVHAINSHGTHVHITDVRDSQKTTLWVSFGCIKDSIKYGTKQIIINPYDASAAYNAVSNRLIENADEIKLLNQLSVHGFKIGEATFVPNQSSLFTCFDSPLISPSIKFFDGLGTVEFSVWGYINATTSIAFNRPPSLKECINHVIKSTRMQATAQKAIDSTELDAHRNALKQFLERLNA